MTRLLLIRHGQTDWNREGRFQGQTDVPLNAVGREQARAMAEQFRSEPPEAIYSSDLLRARQTAESLALVTGAPLHLDPRLREIDLGEWEGMVFADIEKNQGALLARRRRDPMDTYPPGGEGIRSLVARVVPFLQEVLRRHPEALVALVSHGATLAAIKMYLLHLPVESVWDLEPENAAFEEIVVEAP
ncbi:MAG TPA: histidine phosphatase family protein [Anaerolineales bacterium]|nr:histidine phosphatase family protein [Anaerolineales bacterium]